MSTENIQVAVRFRPPHPSELAESNCSSIWALSKSSVLLRPEALQTLSEDKRLPSSQHPSFQYDFAFSAEDNNRKVYETMVRRMVLSTLEGFNATVFAYGQTGSGKTYTMLGVREEENDPPDELNTTAAVRLKPKRGRTGPTLGARNRSLTPVLKSAEATPIKQGLGMTQKGIIVYALEDIFAEVSETMSKHYFFTCSYMEIYNEHVFDLLKETHEMKAEILNIIEGSEKEFYVRGLSEYAVTSMDEVLERLGKGEVNRHYAATAMNHNSSRSHTIFRLIIRSIQVLGEADDEENLTTESILNFVDLAGSERVGTLQAAGDKGSGKSENEKLLAESKNINTSLFYLCQVITKLAEMKLGLIRNDSHIPFRNSNLTKILRSSLGGNAHTCILCTATPTLAQFEQTISTLRFGSSARSITNKVKANVKRETSAQILMVYEQDVSVLRKELEALSQRNRTVQTEGNQNRQQLESRIRKLTQLLYEKTRPSSDLATPKYVCWLPTVGDLIPSNRFIESKGESTRCKGLLCDEDGCFAQYKMQLVVSRLQDTQNCVTALTTAVESYKGVRTGMEEELDSVRKGIEETKEKGREWADRLESLTEELQKVKRRADMYELNLGLEGLSFSDIEDLEATFLLSLDRVKQVKSKLHTDLLISSLKSRLLTYINEEELARVVAFPAPPQPLTPPMVPTIRDISSIPAVTMTSFESFEERWEDGSPFRTPERGNV